MSKGKIKSISSYLNLKQFSIDNNGDLCVTMEMGTFRDSQKISEVTIPSFIKDVRNAAHGVELDRKLAEWLLDRDPTIFDRKEVIIVAEK